jgi:5-methyltetrahydrofolate--homocysteine methyltransferase
MMGVSPAQAVEALADMGLAAIGGNCGNGPDEIEGVIYAMHQAQPGLALIAKSNAGMPEIVEDRAVYSGTPEVMAGYARRARALGATIVGACCGSTPAHIRAIRQALCEQPPLEATDVAHIAAAARQRYDAVAPKRVRSRRTA